MDSANLKSRGADIAAAANQLANSLLALQSPEPSIEHGLPAPLRNEAPVSDASSARLLLLQQLDEMRALLTEPTLILTPELVRFLFRPRHAGLANPKYSGIQT